MTRRLQLLDSESRSSGREVSAIIARVRDGLLRDNKVVPAVLGVTALLIFAWLAAGSLIGGPGDEEQQASSQASLAQGGDSDSREIGTPAPGAENRDSDASYGGYDEGPKDPFRQLIPKAGEEEDGGAQGDRGGGGDHDVASDEDDRDNGGSDRGSSGNGRDGATVRRGNGPDSDEDFIEQRSPSGSRSRSGPGGDQISANRSGDEQASGGQGGVDQADSSGGLFNSGGDLPAP
jgi:hypothetical protein